MPFYTGIDLGKKKSDITVIDDKGNIRIQKKVDSNIAAILDIIKPYRKKQNIVFETCGTYYWLSDGLIEAGYKNLTMAHALKLAHIIKAKVKTDRRDSLALAELHRVGYIPEGYIYPKEERCLRDLARKRLSLVNKRASDFREMKMLLTRHGHKDLKRHRVTNLEAEDIDDYFGDDIHLNFSLNTTVNFNKMYKESITEIEHELETRMKDDSINIKLGNIPGIGKTLSKTIRLEVGDISRFKNIKHFCSWCRVVPGIAQSGASAVRGRGSKQGNAYMKSALSQAACAALRCYPKVNAYYLLHCDRRRSSSGKMVSINIIAHKLALAVWQAFHGNDYDENKLFNIDLLENRRA